MPPKCHSIEAGEQEDCPEIKKEMEEKEKERIELTEMLQIEPYNYKEKYLDLSRRKVTDIKSNPRVMMPDPRPAREEALLAVRTDKLMKVVQEYIKENCDDEGNIKEGNLPAAQERGLKKLLKRICDKEVVVRPTDKSKKLCVNSFESYTNQGRVHVGEDREVGQEEVKIIQKKFM